MSDELFERVRRRDPMPPTVPVEPVDGLPAAELMEHIMTLPITHDVESSSPRRVRRGPRWLVAGLATAVVGVGGVLAAVNIGGGTADAPTTVSYPLTPFDPLTSICLPISEQPQPTAEAIAFGGTVTSIDGDRVVVDVDTWFQNGDADQVELVIGPDMPSPALDGVEFVVGTRYLVTVADGAVGICGVSGPASPELEAIYATWYS
jgi:hypothetical protein